MQQSSIYLDLSDSTKKHSFNSDYFNMIKLGKPTDEKFLLVKEVIDTMVKTCGYRIGVCYRINTINGWVQGIRLS